MRTCHHATAPQPGRHGGRRAFTITELLMVIGVIALLISILTPSVLQVKNVARTAKTRAQLKVFSDALEMFYGNHVVGGDYPPSYWDSSGANNNPYADISQVSGPKNSYAAQGAQTLVWALAGADLLGTPGFVQDQMKTRYALNNGKPAFLRQGPIVDLTKVKIANPSASIMRTNFSPQPSAAVPVFPDAFGMPVLYYRAVKAPDGTPTYYPDDNLAFRDGHNTDGLVHPIYSGNDNNNKKINGLTAFETYTKNFQITAAYQPHNPDTFLLISAGVDGRYGTVDDVTNYPLLTENCPHEFMP